MKSLTSFKQARRLFPHAGKIAYFNSASFGPFSLPLKQAIEANLELRTRAERDDSHEAFTIIDELRGTYAQLVGANKREMGIGFNTSHGINIAAFGLPLKPGDEILIPDIEFPAAVYVWRTAAAERGLKLRLIKTTERCFDIAALEKAVTRKTRVVSISWVQFFNGYKIDLAEISEFCRKRELFLVVDGIQGMGVEPLNLRKLGIDVFTSGCQKWMLSPQGCGFFYISDRVRDRIRQPFVSWLGSDWNMDFTEMFKYDKPLFDSARRFEMGYYATLNLHGMKASAKIFTDLGIRNIQKHNYALNDRLADYIEDSSFYSTTSSMKHRHRSSILTFTCPDYKKLHREILKKKIILVQREGSIRVSSHLFNNEQDIDRLIDVLERFARSR
jgi:selenocysteine lyase/cysteine desulfurase